MSISLNVRSPLDPVNWRLTTVTVICALPNYASYAAKAVGILKIFKLYKSVNPMVFYRNF